jgi:hypothetical protein
MKACDPVTTGRDRGVAALCSLFSENAASRLSLRPWHRRTRIPFLAIIEPSRQAGSPISNLKFQILPPIGARLVTRLQPAGTVGLPHSSCSLAEQLPRHGEAWFRSQPAGRKVESIDSSCNPFENVLRGSTSELPVIARLHVAARRPPKEPGGVAHGNPPLLVIGLIGFPTEWKCEFRGIRSRGSRAAIAGICDPCRADSRDTDMDWVVFGVWEHRKVGSIHGGVSSTLRSRSNFSIWLRRSLSSSPPSRTAKIRALSRRRSFNATSEMRAADLAS